MIRLKSLLLPVLIAFLIAAAQPAGASEVYVLGGVVRSEAPSDLSYSWQLEYRQDLLKHLATGVSYLNEGHVKDHHRDGYTAQLWWRSEVLDDRLTLAAGIGPYFFLDTTSTTSPGGFHDDHGWKAMMSGAATWHLDNNVLLELRSNWVKGATGFTTVSGLAGIGYHFDPGLEPPDNRRRTPDGKVPNEVTLLVGQTIVNSFNSTKSVAGGIEYRRRLSGHFDWTLSGLYEGDTRLVRRDGVMTQLWIAHELIDDTLSVGAGGGIYFNLSSYHNDFQGPGARHLVSGILSLTGSYRLTSHWSLRTTWNRVISSYDRDTDVILGGVGYRY